jgi:hypothetical protein
MHARGLCGQLQWRHIIGPATSSRDSGSRQRRQHIFACDGRRYLKPDAELAPPCTHACTHRLKTTRNHTLNL